MDSGVYGVIGVIVTAIGAFAAVVIQRMPNRVQASDAAMDLMTQVAQELRSELERVKVNYEAELAKLRASYDTEHAQHRIEIETLRADVAKAQTRAAEAEAFSGKLAARVVWMEGQLRAAGLPTAPPDAPAY